MVPPGVVGHHTHVQNCADPMHGAERNTKLNHVELYNPVPGNTTEQHETRWNHMEAPELPYEVRSMIVVAESLQGFVSQVVRVLSSTLFERGRVCVCVCVCVCEL